MTTEVTLTAGDHTFTIRARQRFDQDDPDCESLGWTEEIYEGAHGWDGSGVTHQTPAMCIGQAVRDILDTVDND